MDFTQIWCKKLSLVLVEINFSLSLLHVKHKCMKIRMLIQKYFSPKCSALSKGLEFVVCLCQTYLTDESAGGKFSDIVHAALRRLIALF